MRTLPTLLILISLTVSGQELTPLDSLYAGDSLGLGMQIILKPIQWWQHFSYSQPALNCQFESSCSNFMVEALQQKGLISGLIVGTDRIVRCNPAARHYHLQQPHSQINYDGRLLDPVDWTAVEKPGKSPGLAVALSIVPGLGRTYAGHPMDGFFSLLLVGGFAFNTYNQSLAENPIRTGLNAGFMTLFWVADIYGAYRTAKMAPSDNSTP
ncbi:MAG: membrane protein insertion efficiency factor YidD [Candidatus Marinimicrobia bacterium]|nr:membrane protein insertion efficiency factor YidD [Candidatus Neomarinimicrobiota bacterium]